MTQFETRMVAQMQGKKKCTWNVWKKKKEKRNVERKEQRVGKSLGIKRKRRRVRRRKNNDCEKNEENEEKEKDERKRI